ncbi:hypothetical protein CWN98_12240 [Vibrio splendidus]|nr:hypothetical protein CWN98_12240 [Vibrio splendidus]PTP47476.1 hypothetical protein CWO10_11705 [Vibrio splendidus]
MGQDYIAVYLSNLFTIQSDLRLKDTYRERLFIAEKRQASGAPRIVILCVRVIFRMIKDRKIR